MMKRYLEEIVRIVKEDWLLMLVALVLATIIWWNSTQRQMVTKFLPGVEVNLETNLKPSLRLVSPQHPRVSVYVEGPKAFMESLTSDDFQINADMSDIQDATKHYVFLKPEDFVPKSHLVRALPVDQIRVSRSKGIMPQRIEVETVWNKGVARIVPRIGGNPYYGYIISGSSVTPATLTVAGSEAELELHRIVHNKTEIVLNGEKEIPDQFLTIDQLDLGNLEVLDWDPDALIRIHIDIEPRYMEKTFQSVQVIVLNATEEARNYDFTPKSVEVHVQGDRALLKSVTSTSFAMGLDLSLLPSGTHTLEAKLLTPRDLPYGCSVIEVTPPLITVRIWEPTDAAAPYLRPLTSGDQVFGAGALVKVSTPNQTEQEPENDVASASAEIPEATREETALTPSPPKPEATADPSVPPTPEQ